MGLCTEPYQALPNPQLLVEPFVHREAELSSRIEGTYASQRELVLFKVKPEAVADKADVREVDNYVEALGQGIRLLKKLPISLLYIKV